MSFAHSGRPAASSSNERKYQTGNPVVRWLLDRFLDRVAGELRALGPARVVDLGCGEGLVVSGLRARGLGFDYLGLDRSASALERARAREPGLAFREGDVTAPPPPGEERSADVVLCLEVLEHLADPGAAVERLAAWTQDAALVSVPWEPWFRLGNLVRGQHLGTLGNHPEHVQAFSPATLGRMLRQSFGRVRVETAFPWLLAVARR